MCQGKDMRTRERIRSRLLIRGWTICLRRIRLNWKLWRWRRRRVRVGLKEVPDTSIEGLE